MIPLRRIRNRTAALSRWARCIFRSSAEESEPASWFGCGMRAVYLRRATGFDDLDRYEEDWRPFANDNNDTFSARGGDAATTINR